MPTYDYACATCGPFTASRPMAECAEPTACPACSEPAPRAILSAPSLGSGARSPEAGGGRSMRIHSGGCACCAPSRGASRMVAS